MRLVRLAAAQRVSGQAKLRQLEVEDRWLLWPGGAARVEFADSADSVDKILGFAVAHCE